MSKVSNRGGMSLLALAEMFPDEESARRCRESGVAERAVLRALRERPHEDGAEREADALLVLRLPVLLLRPHRHRARTVESAAPEVGLRRLHHHHERQVGAEHQAGGAHRCHPAHGLVPAATLRKAWNHPGARRRMRGTVEVDETYFGGKEKNKRVKSKLGRGRSARQRW